MKEFIYFYYNTGAIFQTVKSSSPISTQGTPSGLGVIDGNCDIDKSYIDIYDYYVLKSKTESPATIDKTTIPANSIDTCIISNVPNPSTVTIASTSEIVTDGEFEFTIDLPGIYKVKIESVAYLDKTFTVTAT
jgi:hypothetical protein